MVSPDIKERDCMETDRPLDEPLPSWLERVRVIAGWAELCGWYVLAALFPWLVVLAMLGVVPWVSLTPLVALGLLRLARDRRPELRRRH